MKLAATLHRPQNLKFNWLCWVIKVVVVRLALVAVKMDVFFKRYKKAVIITSSVMALQLMFGWDAKFCIINLIWLLV